MPSVLNGFGTWYYGKRRIHRVKGVCQFCKGLCELESYDTTLFIVAAMVPVVPVGQKRILEECKACRRHRVMPLKKWETLKAQAFNEILEKLQANPDDKETIQNALGVATMYQDEVAFDKLADVLSDRSDRDADIQAQLGGAYEYFSRWREAEAAYSKAMTINPTEEIGERLAVCMLKQNRPEEAIRYLSHVFESKDPNKAWLTFWLIEGCMAKGLHEQALELMDARDAAFPSLVAEKSHQKQRRTAEKYKRTGKPIPSKYLGESSKTGYQEGSGLSFKWPRYVGAAVFLGLIALYLGSAFYRGRHRPVYLVNGWNQAYKVNINGKELAVQPGVPQKIDVPEGDVTVDWPQAGEGPQTMPIHTDFWGRPFHRPVFVINPDHLAMVEWRETIYSDSPNVAVNPPKEQFSVNKLVHHFNEVDYEFQSFPAQVQLDHAGSTLRKTRVGLISANGTKDRLVNLTQYAIPMNEQIAYVKRLVQLDPGDDLAVPWLASHLPAKDAIEVVKPRLADRPIRVDWHRWHQWLNETENPSIDMRPEYRRLVEETKRSPGAVYLLGRLEDGLAGEKLYLEAANGNPPSAQACGSLSYRYLVRGDFDRALTWAKKAVSLRPNDVVQRSSYLDALLAAGKYRELIVEAGKDPPNGRLLSISNKMAAMLALGDKAGADMEIARTVSSLGINQSSPAAAQLLAKVRGARRGEGACRARSRQVSRRGGSSLRQTILCG